MEPQVEAWAHGVRTLVEISKQQPQSAYDSLGMLLQLEWQYLQRAVPGVVTMIGAIAEALRETFFPTIFGEEEIDTEFWKHNRL